MSGQTYYFDANALLKYYLPKEESGSLQVQRLVERCDEKILVSDLTLLEFCSVIMKKRRYQKSPVDSEQYRQALNQKQAEQVFERLKRDVRIFFTVVPLPEGAFHLAENILLRDAVIYSIGSNDALHLAIVQKLSSQPILVTSDGSLQRVCERNQMTFYDPEKDFPTQI